MAPTDPVRGSRWWLAYLIVGLAGVVAGPVLPPDVQPLLYTVLGISVLGAVVVGLRVHRPSRPLAWRLLLIAMAVVVAGNVGWALEAANGGTTAGVSAADIVYLGMYPLLATCLAILPVHGRYGAPLAGMTEAGIITCAAAVLSWTMLVDPLVHDAGALPRDLEIVAYPVLDLLILAMAVRMALVTGTRAHAHVLIVFTSAALLVADTAYFVSVSQGGDPAGTPLTVAGWALANVLMGASALHPSMAAVATTRLSPRRVSLPVFVFLVLLSPALTATSLVWEIRGDGVDLLDVIVPSVASMITAVLLVVRLSQMTSVAQRRATDLDARTGELEEALRHQAALREQLSHQATHDSLTGLPNRLLVQQRIEQALADGRMAALLMFDLDGFKAVNDRYGHPAGDALLVAVGRRVSAVVSPTGMLGRLGGDEFAVLVEAPVDDAAALGERVVAAVRQPVAVDGRLLHVSASVGLAPLAGACAAGDAVRDADLALYAAKAAGKNRLVRYAPELRDAQQKRERAHASPLRVADRVVA